MKHIILYSNLEQHAITKYFPPLFINFMDLWFKTLVKKNYNG